MSGNEIWCLAQKGYTPGEIVVGNSVCSLGLAGGIGAQLRGLAGGEIANVTELISEGRHAAIERMEQEAARHGAVGVTGVTSELRHLAGYTEFLSQGTGIHGPGGEHVFSTAASGMETYCHLDCGYAPIRFAMGNVAYALGLGRGLVGSLRTLWRGEVHEFSKMYNDIRHLALRRLQAEAAGLGANAVVDVHVQLLPWGPGAVELLLTGTASHGPVARPDGAVVTSELTGEELWNLASLGYSPVQLVMATSVVSLGVAAGVGTLLQSLSRGELPELTRMIYEARERCLDLLRREAEAVGAERVVGNRLTLRELMPGLIEMVALGTAVARAEGVKPASPALVPQAIIVERAALEDPLTRTEPAPAQAALLRSAQLGQGATGCLGAIVPLVIFFVLVCAGALSSLGH
jgi:uncharacterized protein YbjQ (UPF0145 family)